MLNCREVAERASAYLDAGLGWRERLQMRLHLAMCRICREYVRQLGLIVSALHKLPRGPGPDEAFLDRLRAAVRAQAADR